MVCKVPSIICFCVDNYKFLLKVHVHAQGRVHVFVNVNVHAHMHLHVHVRVHAQKLFACRICIEFFRSSAITIVVVVIVSLGVSVAARSAMTPKAIAE